MCSICPFRFHSVTKRLKGEQECPLVPISNKGKDRGDDERVMYSKRQTQNLLQIDVNNTKY